MALEDAQRDALHNKVAALYDELSTVLAGDQPDRARVQSSSTSDPILTRLEALAAGKGGPPLDETGWQRCVKEGKRRAETFIPPGYLDAEKETTDLPEGPAGDYLVWYQACDASKSQNLDLVLVVRR